MEFPDAAAPPKSEIRLWRGGWQAWRNGGVGIRHPDLRIAMWENIVNQFILLFVVVDPVGVATLFAAMTVGDSEKLRQRTAVRATLLATAILLVFIFGGNWLLHALGISLYAFQIAGGILLLLLALDMAFAKRSGLRSTTGKELEEAIQKEDITVFPLAFPLIAGPGAITSTMFIAADCQRRGVGLTASLAVLAVVLLLTLAALWMSGRIVSLLGETGANVIDRLFGLLLAALAVQFVLDGIRGAFPAAIPP
jgi:multiple antibiotic resistance protein